MIRAKKNTVLFLWILLILTVFTACKSDIPNGTILSEEESITSTSLTENVTQPIIEEHLNSETISKYSIVYSSDSRDSKERNTVINERL